MMTLSTAITQALHRVRPGSTPGIERRCRTRCFTLPEALAALVLAAIVVPVVMHAASIAGRSSELARRTERAARLADLKLQELVTSGDWQETEAAGEFDDFPGFSWEFEAADWGEDEDLGTGLTQVTVTVRFALRNRTESVVLSTLVQGGEQ